MRAGNCIACGSSRRNPRRACVTRTASGCSTSTRTAGARARPTAGTGKLYRSAFIDASERYGDLATNDNLWWVYDFSSGAYSITQNKSDPDLYTKSIPPMPAREVDPEAMAANAVR